MFGKNKVLKVSTSRTALLVHSLFPTLQGEGPFAGQPAVFLRLGGCSLACSWCDTEFERGAKEVSLTTLVEQIDTLRPGAHAAFRPLCVITGGEPMRQNIAPLSFALVEAGWRVQVETAGIHWCNEFSDMEELLLHDREGTPPPITFVCSPKTTRVNEYLEAVCTHWKYIVDASAPYSESDGLPIYAVSQAGRPNNNMLYRPPYMEQQYVYVQPLDVPSSPEQSQRNVRQCVELAQRYGYQLSLQQHKILELP